MLLWGGREIQDSIVSLARLFLANNTYLGNVISCFSPISSENIYISASQVLQKYPKFSGITPENLYILYSISNERYFIRILNETTTQQSIFIDHKILTVFFSGCLIITSFPPTEKTVTGFPVTEQPSKLQKYFDLRKGPGFKLERMQCGFKDVC